MNRELVAEVQPSASHLSMLRAVVKSGPSSSLSSPVQFLSRKEYEERILLGRGAVSRSKSKGKKGDTTNKKKDSKTDSQEWDKESKDKADKVKLDAVAKLLLYGKDFEQLEGWVDDTDDNMKAVASRNSDSEEESEDDDSEEDSSDDELNQEKALDQEFKKKLMEERRNKKEQALKQMFDSKYTDTFFMLNKHRMDQIYENISALEKEKKRRRIIRKKRKELDRVGGKKKIALDESETQIKAQPWSAAEAKRDALKAEARLQKLKNKKKSKH